MNPKQHKMYFLVGKVYVPYSMRIMKHSNLHLGGYATKLKIMACYVCYCYCYCLYIYIYMYIYKR